MGVEAGHKGEELAEHGVPSAVRYYRMANKSSAQHNSSSNPLSRYLQKKRIQREYSKKVRQGEHTAATTVAKAKEAAKKALEFVRKHNKPVWLVIGLSAVVAMLFGGISSCSMMAGSGVGSVFTSSYLSEDIDLLAAEEAYLAMEEELQAYLDTYQDSHDYDEYHFELDDIGHDPYVLLSILSALHDGTFTIDEVQDDLEMLFEKQYILTEAVTTETRYRRETYSWIDEDGNIHTDTYRVPYTYSICNVKLENYNLSHVPADIMDEETLSLYAAYMATLGNREDLFADSDYVSLYITDPPEDYKIPSHYLSDERFATLIEEAEKYLGYPYVWGGLSAMVKV